MQERRWIFSAKTWSYLLGRKKMTTRGTSVCLCPSVRPSVMSVRPFVRPFVRPSCPFVRPSIRPWVASSLYLNACLLERLTRQFRETLWQRSKETHGNMHMVYHEQAAIEVCSYLLYHWFINQNRVPPPIVRPRPPIDRPRQIVRSLISSLVDGFVP